MSSVQWLDELFYRIEKTQLAQDTSTMGQDANGCPFLGRNLISLLQNDIVDTNSAQTVSQSEAGNGAADDDDRELLGFHLYFV